MISGVHVEMEMILRQTDRRDVLSTRRDVPLTYLDPEHKLRATAKGAHI